MLCLLLLFPKLLQTIFRCLLITFDLKYSWVFDFLQGMLNKLGFRLVWGWPNYSNASRRVTKPGGPTKLSQDLLERGGRCVWLAGKREHSNAENGTQQR